MVRNDTIDPGNLKKPGIKTEKYNVAMLLKSLGVDELMTTEWEARACKDHGMSKRTFQIKLATIKDDPNQVTKTEDGKWKATSPIFPPGWNAVRAAEAKKEAEVQQCN